MMRIFLTNWFNTLTFCFSVIRAHNFATLRCETTIVSFIKVELKKLIANERPIVARGWSETKSLIREQEKKEAPQTHLLYEHPIKLHFILKKYKDELKIGMNLAHYK